VTDGIDVGRFVRLVGAIRAAIDSADPGLAAVAGNALAQTYSRLRAEARNLVPDDRRDELDRVCPETLQATGGSRMLLQAARFNAARSALSILAGWLQGFVDEARMAMEARAYAEARVKEERGVGFKPPSS